MYRLIMTSDFKSVNCYIVLYVIAHDIWKRKFFIQSTENFNAKYDMLCHVMVNYSFVRNISNVVANVVKQSS